MVYAIREARAGVGAWDEETLDRTLGLGVIISQQKGVAGSPPRRRYGTIVTRKRCRPGTEAADRADAGPGDCVVCGGVAGGRAEGWLGPVAGGAGRRHDEQVRAGVVLDDPPEARCRVLDGEPGWAVGEIAVRAGLAGQLLPCGTGGLGGFRALGDNPCRLGRERGSGNDADEHALVADRWGRELAA